MSIYIRITTKLKSNLQTQDLKTQKIDNVRIYEEEMYA
jgi:hypothetical protein